LSLTPHRNAYRQDHTCQNGTYSFFFQAEDGIRDFHVTGVQTCALPISGDLKLAMKLQSMIDPLKDAVYGAGEPTGEAHGRMKAAMQVAGVIRDATVRPPTHAPSAEEMRSEERRVGKGRRAGRAPSLDEE